MSHTQYLLKINLYCVVFLLLFSCNKNKVAIDEIRNSPTDVIEENDQLAVFSSDPLSTKTTMDVNRNFYWNSYEKIWVKTAEDTYLDSYRSELIPNGSGKYPSAKFYFNQNLKEESYEIYYTGNYSSSAQNVTIYQAQQQSSWDNADHIGWSGDCGTATAIKKANNKYDFKLNHKAAYLIFRPYKATNITASWKIMSIEIIDNDGNTLCGKYPLELEGLKTTDVTNGNSNVVLYCSSPSGFELETSASKSCFVVIQPGTHSLTIRYTIKPETSVNGVTGKTFTIEKKITSITEYAPNSVTRIQHKLSALSLNSLEFDMRQWGATGTFYATYDQSSPQKGNYDKTTLSPNQLTTDLWKDLPTANEAAWYLLRGDVRVDRNTYWFMDGTGGAIGNRGVWILKKEYIDGFTDEVCPLGRDLNGADGNYVYSYRPQTLSVYINVAFPELLDNYENGGVPNNDQIHKYFFLPALGYIRSDLNQESGKYSHCYFWTKSPSTLENAVGLSTHYRMAYILNFSTGDNLGQNATARLTGWWGRKEGGGLAPAWFE